MANAGEITELINAAKVTLTNTTNSLDFGQLYNIIWSGRVPNVEKTRTDGTRDELDRGRRIRIDADIWMTTPEITTMNSYNTPTGSPPQLPVKNWDFKTTARDGSTDTLRIAGKLRDFSMLAPENGGAWFHIGITSTSAVVSEP